MCVCVCLFGFDVFQRHSQTISTLQLTFFSLSRFFIAFCSILILLDFGRTHTAGEQYSEQELKNVHH